MFASKLKPLEDITAIHKDLEFVFFKTANVLQYSKSFFRVVSIVQKVFRVESKI